MPWSQKQNRLFHAAASDPAVAQRVGIPQARAKEMAGEGVKVVKSPERARMLGKMLGRSGK